MHRPLILCAFLVFLLCSCTRESLTLAVSETAHARVGFGVERLVSALEEAGYEVHISRGDELPDDKPLIVVGEISQQLIKNSMAYKNFGMEKSPGKEGYAIRSSDDMRMIAGADASGTLYGCLELAELVREQGKLPAELNVTDQPKMVLRGACIGVQKTTYLPGRSVYEYPYTPENFPWFYDKALWVKYLDMLVANRMNSLYLWNGHPFASLVKLDDYPYALEVDEETFRKNEEMFSFLTAEADKRGIWVIQMFYNIIVSKPFAEKHQLKTQDRQRPILPLIADYTQKSIAAFVEKYPNVGLLVTLGEAMSGEENDVKWFTETIIPGVKEGLEALGKTAQPPIVLRGHDTNPQLVMEAALPLYKNLYTMNKYNGEALTTYQPRGPWAAMHQDLSRLGSTHIDNVHILANLEPFRYGSADFIQKSVKAMHESHGANGLHLYPQASYWDWPYTADKVSPRLLQLDRDWIWYKAWGRYAWNSQRDRAAEIAYWTDLLGRKYGCGEHAKEILEAYEQSGEIAPKLLRRFGITNGNRQTLTLGMFMSQLVNPHKWNVWQHLYDSDGPEGEMLMEYAEREWKNEPHLGETPPQIIEEVTKHAQLAVEAIEKSTPYVTENKEEFARLKNDIHCYRALADFFSEKVKAAALVLRYHYSQDISDLEKALPHLEQSIAHYRELTDLTEGAYYYANSMQTAQRRIPIGGDEGKNKTWEELLPHYLEELHNFKGNLRLLKSSEEALYARNGNMTALEPVQVTLLNPEVQFYQVEAGNHAFADKASEIKEVADELKQLEGIQLSVAKQREEGTRIQFENEHPVKLLVGFFQSGDEGFLTPPDLETDTTAHEHGQAEAKIVNAIKLPGWPPVNVHAYHFNKGKNTLALPKGACLILGFTDGSVEIEARDAGLSGAAYREGADWLFD